MFAGEEFPEPGTAQRLRERGHEFDASGPLSGPPLRRRSNISGGIEWKISRAPDRPKPRNRDAFQ